MKFPCDMLAFAYLRRNQLLVKQMVLCSLVLKRKGEAIELGSNPLQLGKADGFKVGLKVIPLQTLQPVAKAADWPQSGRGQPEARSGDDRDKRRADRYKITEVLPDFVDFVGRVRDDVNPFAIVSPRLAGRTLTNSTCGLGAMRRTNQLGAASPMARSAAVSFIAAGSGEDVIPSKTCRVGGKCFSASVSVAAKSCLSQRPRRSAHGQGLNWL